jgi:putative NADPH-quinone reductase
MKYYIVVAHPEPTSFNLAAVQQARQALEAAAMK